MRTPEAYVNEALVLPDDATIVSVDLFSLELAEKLGAVPGEVAVSRAKSRFPAKILSAELGEFLTAFRSPRRITDAVIDYAARHDLSAMDLLDEVFPILKELVDASFLVSGESNKSLTELRFGAGDRIADYTVVRPVQILDDSAVYCATSPAYGFVALKVVRAEDASSVRRLAAEADTLRALAACRVPPVVSYEVTSTIAILATQWLGGICVETWADAVRERRLDDSATFVTLEACIGIAMAYAEIHAGGIVHGDVHPKNILLLRDSTARLLDFGLACAAGSGRRSRRGGIGFYFEPEYATARLAGELPPPATKASEQFALGALLFRLLCGNHYISFSLEKDAAFRQIVSGEVRSFSQAGAQPFPAVETVLRRMLSVAPEKRYPSMSDVVDALRQALESLPPPVDTDAYRPILASYVAQTIETLHDQRRVAFDAPRASIAMGASGTSYGLYHMAIAASDPSLLELADIYAEAAQSEREREGAFYVSDEGLTEDVLTPHSVLYAEPGVWYVRALVAHARGDAFGLNTAILGFALAASTPNDHKLDFAFGAPGILSACADLVRVAACHSFVDDAPARELGARTCDAILREIEKRRPAKGQPPALSGFLGAAHGWAGTLFALLKWHEVASEPVHESVREALDLVAALRVPVDRGMGWPRKWPASSPEYFSSWCNGSAGFVHLWLAAHRTYCDDKYRAFAEDAAWSTFDAKDTTLDLCCGAAGRVYALLAYSRATGDQHWRDRAAELAALAVRKAKPARFMRERSLFKGVVGLAVACSAIALEGGAMPMFAFEP